MTLVEFATYVRDKFAPQRGDIREISYNTDGGHIIACAYVKVGHWGTDTVIASGSDPFNPEWESVVVHINQILKSSAWCHAIAEDYLVGGGMANSECRAILRKLARQLGIDIGE